MQLFEQQITSIIGGHIGQFLQVYASNPASEWKAKDTAIYLLTSIASRGSTQHQGVTTVNTLIDVVDWFSQNVFTDLQGESSAVHPILQVDAIKYLYTFRNQASRPVLFSKATSTYTIISPYPYSLRKSNCSLFFLCWSST